MAWRSTQFTYFQQCGVRCLIAGRLSIEIYLRPLSGLAMYLQDVESIWEFELDRRAQLRRISGWPTEKGPSAATT